MINFAALGFLRNFCISFSPKQHTISVFYIDGTLSGLGLGLGLAMQLVSAFRCRRQKLYLNRARFWNCPWSRTPHPEESYGSTLRPCIILCFLFFLPIFLVAACTTCAGFHNSNGRKSTVEVNCSLNLHQLLSLGYKLDNWIKILLEFLVSLKQRIRWIREKNCVLPWRVINYTSRPQCIVILCFA